METAAGQASAASDAFSATNKAPLAGVFTGGTDATIGSTKMPGGLEQVNVDVASGDLQVTPPDSDADAAALAVTKSTGAGSGIGLGEFALGALGAAAIGAALSGGGGDDSAAAAAFGGGTGVMTAGGYRQFAQPRNRPNDQERGFQAARYMLGLAWAKWFGFEKAAEMILQDGRA